MRTILLLFLASLSAPLLAAEEQQLAIRPNENLAVDGIPPIPAAIMEKAGKYTEYRVASFGSCPRQARNADPDKIRGNASGSSGPVSGRREEAADIFS